MSCYESSLMQGWLTIRCSTLSWVVCLFDFFLIRVINLPFPLLWMCLASSLMTSPTIQSAQIPKEGILLDLIHNGQFFQLTWITSSPLIITVAISSTCRRSWWISARRSPVSQARSLSRCSLWEEQDLIPLTDERCAWLFNILYHIEFI